MSSINHYPLYVIRSVLVTALLAVSLAQAQPVQIEPEAAVLVTSMHAKLRRGKKVIAPVAPLSVLRVIEVRGNWIGVFVERNGQKHGGWLARTDIHFLAANDPSTTEAIRRVRTALLSGSWEKDHSSPDDVHGHHDIHRYTFHANGTYRGKYYTDYTTPTITGKWRLYRDGPGKVHLLLYHSRPQRPEHAHDPVYCWLGPDTVVEYDPFDDVLLISRPPHVGVQKMRRCKPVPPEDR